MATSGSTSVSFTSWDTLKFSWWENSQSIANNTTTIGWKLELIAGSSGCIDSTASKDWSVTVNGTKYSGTNKIGISNNATKTLASGTTTISHNSDGTKTFSYSFSQEIAIYWGSTYIGSKSGSGTGTLDTIPRKSTLSVGNGVLGSTQTLTVTRQSNSFTHTITASCGGETVNICNKSTATSINFTPFLKWASENTTGTSVSVKYTITTYNGNTSIGSNSYTVTCSIPSNVAPTCSIEVTDPTGYADIYGGFIKGLSKFKVVVTPTISYGSAIASYSTKANDATYTAASFTTDVLKSSGSLTVKATVKDKRGRSGSASVSKTVLDYSAPVINKLTVGRCNADGTANDQGEYAKVTFSGLITSLNNKNSASYKLQYKKSGSSGDPTEVILTDYDGLYSVTDGTYIFAADTGSSYDVKIFAIDDFDSTPRTTSVSTGFTLMHWLASGRGMAIGKVAELEDTLDVKMRTVIRGDEYASGTSESGQLIIGDPYGYHIAFDNNEIMAKSNATTPSQLNVNSDGGLVVIGGSLTTGGNINMPNNTSISIKNSSGAARPVVLMNSENTTSFGYGGWANSEGTSVFEGNNILIRSRGYVSVISPYSGITEERYYGYCKTLWTGGHYMTADQTVTLSQGVQNQPNGIILVFSQYANWDSQNAHFVQFFVPKGFVAAFPGSGSSFLMFRHTVLAPCTKYLYINNTTITGHANNDMNTTANAASGIKWEMDAFVLRAVYGV